MKSVFLQHPFELFNASISSKSILLSDSGGTKTDWCLISAQTHYYFETLSYHPSDLPSADYLDDFWSQLTKISQVSVYFFGSGCASSIQKLHIKRYFKKYAWASFDVDSDLVAAGIALWKNQSGFIGILGTGSVSAFYSEKAISNVSGGLGYILGDEGSGFYFGKILIQKLLNNELSGSLSAELYQALGNRGEILSKIYSEKGRTFISSIQTNEFITKEELIQEISIIHRENIRLFIQTSLPAIVKETSISFVGSYAYFHEKLLTEELRFNNWKLVRVIQKPIQGLVEYFDQQMIES